MRKGTRRATTFTAVLALIVSLLRSDPNARGPLAYAVEYWLAGQDERASAEFERAAMILEGLAIDRRFIELPATIDASAIAPIEGVLDLEALRIALDRCCRDERSAALLTALALARSGDPQRAEANLKRAAQEPAHPRIQALMATLTPR